MRLKVMNDSEMKKNVSLSVIVPVYNTVKELPKCLDSICNQSFKNIEILIVDDGSTDGSEIICDEYAEKDSRIVLIHKPNGGESSARNVGLKCSTGDFITFVDCDDWLEPDMYDILVGKMISDKLDMVCSSWIKELPQKSIFISNEEEVDEGIFGRNKLLEYIYKRDSYRGFAYMWDKIYRRNILTDESGQLFMFDETIGLGGDVIYLAQAALNSHRIKYVDRCFYHYNQRENSGCHTSNLSRLYEWVHSYTIVIDMLENEGVDKMIIDYAKRFKAYHALEGAKEARKTNAIDWFEKFQSVMLENEGVYKALNREHPERILEYNNLLNL